MGVCVASRTSVFVVGVPVMKEKKGDIYIYHCYVYVRCRVRKRSLHFIFYICSRHEKKMSGYVYKRMWVRVCANISIKESTEFLLHDNKIIE